MSTTVAMPANFREFAIAGTVRLWPSARSKLASVKCSGSTVPYQSRENATTTTPRCGSTAIAVIPPKSSVQPSAASRPGRRAPPVLVALAIMA